MRNPLRFDEAAERARLEADAFSICDSSAINACQCVACGIARKRRDEVLRACVEARLRLRRETHHTQLWSLAFTAVIVLFAIVGVLL